MQSGMRFNFEGTIRVAECASRVTAVADNDSRAHARVLA
jgi:hypothetical protein